MLASLSEITAFNERYLAHLSLLALAIWLAFSSLAVSSVTGALQFSIAVNFVEARSLQVLD